MTQQEILLVKQLQIKTALLNNLEQSFFENPTVENCQRFTSAETEYNDILDQLIDSGIGINGSLASFIQAHVSF